jgi:hypothetical protein
MTAEQKQRDIWALLSDGGVRSNTEGIEWPQSAAILSFIKTDFSEIMTSENWNLPPQTTIDSCDWKSDASPKVLCAHGVVVCVRIEYYSDYDFPYSGLFSQKADFGIMRLSSALAPNISGYFPDSALFPCGSLKMFRTNAPSGNILFGGKKTGQPEDFFFAKSICNHLTEKTSFILQWVLLIFKQYSAYPTQGGLSNFAKAGEDGIQLQQEEVKFPWCVNLFPLLKEEAFPLRMERKAGQVLQQPKAAPTIMSWFDTTATTSSTTLPPAAAATDHLNDLLEIPEGTAVFEIQAIRNPTTALANNFEKIGRIITTSPCIFSQHDANLIFKHQKMEEDVSMQPAWAGELVKEHTEIGASFFDRHPLNATG